MRRGVSIILLGVAACAPPAPRTVPRIVDGQIEEGAFVSPYAYERFIEAEVFATKNAHDEAAIAFETAATASSEDVLLMTRLAEEYEVSGASRRADRVLVLARRSYPESPQVWLSEGRIKARRGDFDEAVAAFLEARRLAPNWGPPVIALAATLQARGHSLRANALLIDYISNRYDTRSEDARRALVNLARAEDAAETLEKALALRAESHEEQDAFLAAQLALNTAQPALAARMLADTLESPANRMLWFRSLLASGDLGTARDFLANVPSEEVGGEVDHAELLIAVGEWDGALKLLEAAPQSPRSRYDEGIALLGRGDYGNACRVLAEVPEGSSTFEAARIAFAESSTALGRTGAAAEALSLAPHDSLAVRTKMAELYLSQGNLRAGLRLFDAKVPADRPAVAALFERAGRYQEAAAYYATVEASLAENPAVHVRAAAEHLAARGLYGPATAVLERWAAIAPEDLYARVRLVELLETDDRHEAAIETGLAALPFVDDPLLRAHLVTLLAAVD